MFRQVTIACMCACVYIIEIHL